MLQGVPSLIKSQSVFAPPQIAGLVSWYKADTLSLNDGDAVATWNDSYGTNTFTQSTAIWKPIFKTNILNGFPILRFDGSNDNLQCAGFAGTGISQPNTIFVVGLQSSKATPARFIDCSSAARQLVGLNTSGFFDCHAGSTLNDSVDHSGVFHYLTVVFNGASSFGYLDGTQVVSGNTGSNNYGGNNAIIGSDGNIGVLAGDIAEILFYTGALSDTNRARVEQYLKRKYTL